MQEISKNAILDKNLFCGYFTIILISLVTIHVEKEAPVEKQRCLTAVGLQTPTGTVKKRTEQHFFSKQFYSSILHKKVVFRMCVHGCSNCLQFKDIKQAKWNTKKCFRIYSQKSWQAKILTKCKLCPKMSPLPKVKPISTYLSSVSRENFSVEKNLFLFIILKSFGKKTK